jgi:hypothetical protein
VAMAALSNGGAASQSDLNVTRREISGASRAHPPPSFGRCRIDDRSDEPQFVIPGNDRSNFFDLPPPAKQLLRRQSVPARHPGNRVAAGLDLRDDPRLVLVTPCPTASRTGEHLKPANRLGDSTIHCVYSKPSGCKELKSHRSERQSEGEAGTTLTIKPCRAPWSA